MLNYGMALRSIVLSFTLFTALAQSPGAREVIRDGNRDRRGGRKQGKGHMQEPSKVRKMEGRREKKKRGRKKGYKENGKRKRRKRMKR